MKRKTVALIVVAGVFALLFGMVILVLAGIISPMFFAPLVLSLTGEHVDVQEIAPDAQEYFSCGSVCIPSQNLEMEFDSGKYVFSNEDLCMSLIITGKSLNDSESYLKERIALMQSDLLEAGLQPTVLESSVAGHKSFSLIVRVPTPFMVTLWYDEVDGSIYVLDAFNGTWTQVRQVLDGIVPSSKGE